MNYKLRWWCVFIGSIDAWPGAEKVAAYRSALAIAGKFARFGYPWLILVSLGDERGHELTN